MATVVPKSSNQRRKSMPTIMNPRISYAVLEQQVEGLESYVQNLSSSIVGLDRKMSESMTILGGKMDTAIASINAKLDEKSRTHWPTLIAAGSLLVVIMGSLGGLAYLPIKGSMEAAFDEIREMRKIELGRAEQMGWVRAKLGQDMPN